MKILVSDCDAFVEIGHSNVEMVKFDGVVFAEVDKTPVRLKYGGKTFVFYRYHAFKEVCGERTIYIKKCDYDCLMNKYKCKWEDDFLQMYEEGYEDVVYTVPCYFITAALEDGKRQTLTYPLRRSDIVDVTPVVIMDGEEPVVSFRVTTKNWMGVYLKVEDWKLATRVINIWKKNMK